MLPSSPELWRDAKRLLDLPRLDRVPPDVFDIVIVPDHRPYLH